MDAVEAVDERSLTAVLGPGLRLPEAERALGARGLRLAHVPAELRVGDGRRLRRRPARPASPRPGTAGSTRTSSRCAARRRPGSWRRSARPPAPRGRRCASWSSGSEGAIGVITRVALRVRPLAPAQRHEGWFARSFADGCEALRRLEQEGLAPDIARLSDETETRVSLALAGPAARARAGSPPRARSATATAACSCSAGRTPSARSAPAAGPPPRCCAAPGCSTRGSGRGRRGRARGSPGRTCATTCSTAARSSRRSRPRRAGPAWRRCATRSPARCAACSAARWSAATSRTCIPPAPRCTSRC